MITACVTIHAQSNITQQNTRTLPEPSHPPPPPPGLEAETRVGLVAPHTLVDDPIQEIEMGELKVVQALLCCATGLYCPSFKQCFGGHCEGEVTCMNIDMMLCKMMDSAANEDNECCILLNAKVACKKPQVVRRQTICTCTRYHSSWEY